MPHYLLFDSSRGGREAGHCRFVLRAADGSDRLEAEASEPGVSGERLALLSIVRGLEALERPSRVTLVTPSPYVREGIRRGLTDWRRNGWRWECFGQMVPVKHLDLWQRVDRAMQYHEVDCRMYRIDCPHHGGTLEDGAAHAPEGDAVSSIDAPERVQYPFGRFAIRLGRRMLAIAGGWIRRLPPVGWIRRLAPVGKTNRV